MRIFTKCKVIRHILGKAGTITVANRHLSRRPFDLLAAENVTHSRRVPVAATTGDDTQCVNRTNNSLRPKRDMRQRRSGGGGLTEKLPPSTVLDIGRMHVMTARKDQPLIDRPLKVDVVKDKIVLDKELPFAVSLTRDTDLETGIVLVNTASVLARARTSWPAHIANYLGGVSKIKRVLSQSSQRGRSRLRMAASAS